MSCMIHASLFLYVSYMCIMFLSVLVMTREVLLEECITVLDIREKVKQMHGKSFSKEAKGRKIAHGHDRLGLSRGRGHEP